MLVAGIRGLGAEVCKNLVLAGVKSLCVLDNRQAGPEDIGSHFLIAREDFGESVSVSLDVHDMLSNGECTNGCVD